MSDLTTRVRCGVWNGDACVFVIFVEAWVLTNGRWYAACPFQAGHEVNLTGGRETFLNMFGDRLPKLPAHAFGGVDVRPRNEPGKGRDFIWNMGRWCRERAAA